MPVALKHRITAAGSLLARLPKLNLFDELRFADMPNEFAGFERLDKYTLRKWLIGHAVVNGCTYRRAVDEDLEAMDRGQQLFRVGFIERGAERVEIRIESGGLRLSTADQTEFIPTKF